MPTQQENLMSRKFILTSFSLVTTFVALFLDKISGGELVALVPLILGVYTGGNVIARNIDSGAGK